LAILLVCVAAWLVQEKTNPEQKTISQQMAAGGRNRDYPAGFWPAHLASWQHPVYPGRR
jgi:hypothetical protein